MRESLGDLIGGIDGVGGAGAFELAAAEPEAGLAFKASRSMARRWASADRGLPCLKRGLGAGHEEHGIEPRLLQGVVREDEMAVMDGIEGAAENAEPQGAPAGAPPWLRPPPRKCRPRNRAGRAVGD